MNTLKTFLAAFLLLAGVSVAEPMVSEAELNEIARLVTLGKERHEAGLINKTEILNAERLHLRAQYWAEKITRTEFLAKANALNARLIEQLKEQIASGVTNQLALLKAYENMFDDRRLP